MEAFSLPFSKTAMVVFLCGDKGGTMQQFSDKNSFWKNLLSASHFYGTKSVSAFVPGLCRLSGIDGAA